MAEKRTNRAKLFIQNMAVFGASTVLTKLVPLIMLPIITALLTDTADYGRYDMFQTIVEFGTNIAVLGLYDAMFREFFEKDDPAYKKQVTSTALNIVMMAGVAVCLILAGLNRWFSRLFLGDFSSGPIVSLAGVTVFFAACERMLAAPLKMENRRKTILVMGVGGALLHYALAMVFVLSGLNYAGMIYSYVVYIALMVGIYTALNRRHFRLGMVNKPVAEELLKIGLPLMPMFIIYWVFHAMDKIMITNMIGLAAEGVYSVGARMAQISQIINAAFSMGWQYFAFSTMRDGDQVQLNSRVLHFLGLASYLAFIGVTFFDNWFFGTFFRGDYTLGGVVFPYLFLSPLILMLYQVIANQTLVYKKSYLSTLSLLAGVVTNLVLNYFLIKAVGIEGAAIATLLSYMVSFLSIALIARRRDWLVLNGRFILITLLALVHLAALIFLGQTAQTVSGVLCAVLILAVSRKDIRFIIERVKAR